MAVIAPSVDLKVEAWHDCWAFFDLLKYQGGTKNFDECHFDFILVLSAYQLWQSGRLTPALAKRWALLCEYPEDLLIKDDGTVRCPPTNRLLQMPRGHFKAQALDCRVLTPTGWTTIGQLSVGDEVVGRHGKAVKVTKLHPISEMTLYSVQTADGRETYCNAEHLWEVYVPSNYRDGKPRVLTTKRIAELTGINRLDKRSGKTFYENRAYIKPVAISGEYQYSPVEPYTLGYWLGDGTSSCGSITTADLEVLDYLDRPYFKVAAKYRYNAYGMKTDLADLGVLNDKHIPPNLLLDTYERRLELLQGIMDSDGSCHADGKIAYFSNKSKQLVDDVVALVRSLGGIARVCETVSTQFDASGVTYYTVSVKLPPSVCPFKLKRKAAVWVGSLDLRCYITSVSELLKPGLARCISVEDEIYITDDYLPTHNSTLTVGYIMWRIYRNPDIRIMHATNIKELSQSFIRELRSYFEDEELQDSVWNTRPHIKGSLIPPLDRSNRRYYGDENEAEDRKVVWSNSQLQMNRGIKAKEPTVFSTSVKAKATGQHFDIVIMDDIVDFDNCATPAKIKQVKRWAADVASIRTKVVSKWNCGVMPDGTRLSEKLGDEYVVTGTHYDPGDYYAFIKENYKSLKFGVFNRNIYANGVDNTDGYLWKRFSAETEAELRAELSDMPGVFEAQYLNLVNNPALQVLTTDYIEWVSLDELMQNRSNVGVTYRDANGTLDNFEPIMAVDFAVSLSSRADYTAICVGGKSYQRKLVCCDFSVGHYSVEQTLAEIVRLVKLWGVKRMYVETIGFQALYRDQIIKRLVDAKISCGVLDYKPVGNKHKRIESHLSSYFAEGQTIFSSHLKTQAIVMNSFNFFGRASAKDDPPDALAVVAEHSHPRQEKGSRWNKSRFQREESSGNWNIRYGGVY